MAAETAGGQAPTQFTGFLLRRAYLVCRERVEACIGEESSVREVPLLTLVGDDEPVSQRRLGDLLSLNRTTTSKAVDALVHKGWVTRDRDLLDRRSYALRLTTDGRAALAVLHSSIDRGEARLTGALTDSERQRLRRALCCLLIDDATLDIPGLGDRCSYLVARAHRAMFRRAAEVLAPFGLSPRDVGMLGALAVAQPCSQQRLAEILGISAPAVLGFVDELESAGLVSRRRNSADRRAYDLTLTSTGVTMLDAGRRAADELQSSVSAVMGEAADKDLRQLLRKIIESARDESAMPVQGTGTSVGPRALSPS